MVSPSSMSFLIVGSRFLGGLFLLIFLLSCQCFIESSCTIFHLLPRVHQLYSNFRSMNSLTAYGLRSESFRAENCLATDISVISNRIDRSFLCTVATFDGDILFFIHFPLLSSFQFGSMNGIFLLVIQLNRYLLAIAYFLVLRDLCILDLVSLEYMFLMFWLVLLFLLLLRFCSLAQLQR